MTTERIIALARTQDRKRQQQWLEPIRFYVKSGFADNEVALAHFDQALAELESTLALSQRNFKE